MMKNELPTATPGLSHDSSTLANKGPQNPPMKQGHQRHIESPPFFSSGDAVIRCSCRKSG
jgi:hypothetical protein